MSFRPFSKRSKPAPETLKYVIPVGIRSRINFSLRGEIGEYSSFEDMVVDAGREGLKAYGTLKASGHVDLDEASVEHFLKCSDEEFIDFLEWMFRSNSYRSEQTGVACVNRILREEGIGYEFSPYVVTLIPHPTKPEYRKRKIQYPEATVKSNELLHATTVMPALQLLSGATWTTADEEMLKAHEHLRDGNYADAMIWAGKCFESVLKTICDTKKWPYKPDIDTLGILIQTCHSNKLFPEPYVKVFLQSSGTLRNKFGGHGQGPIPPHGVADARMAEHMLQITSAHVVLLAKMAGMA